MLVYQRVCVDHSLFKTLKIDSPPIYQTAPWWPLPSPVAAHDAAPHSASVASNDGDFSGKHVGISPKDWGNGQQNLGIGAQKCWGNLQKIHFKSLE